MARILSQVVAQDFKFARNGIGCFEAEPFENLCIIRRTVGLGRSDADLAQREPTKDGNHHERSSHWTTLVNR